MVQFAGKYELVESKNFLEFLIKVGASEEEAKKASAAKAVVKVEVDGNKYTIHNESNGHISNLVLGEEIEEVFRSNVPIKTISKLEGNTIFAASKHPDGKPAGKRSLTFTDSGLEEKLKSPGDDSVEAIRIYKRI